MSRNVDWRSYVTEEGDFELAAYLFRTINFLMKTSLDMGTLLSTDQTRLRAYKEQTKAIFKNRWLEIAQALEAFEIIVPCGCGTEYCKVCGGARYRLNGALTADQIREISFITAPEDDSELAAKLRAGLEKAQQELQL